MKNKYSNQFHTEAIRIQTLLRRINPKGYYSFYSADTIDICPLAAFSLFFGTLYHKCPKSYYRILERINKTMDEILCCVGNKELCEDFNYPNDNYMYIKGHNNQEVINCIIEQMEQCYRLIYRK